MYTWREGDTLPAVAQDLLGSASLWHQLNIPGWNGDPQTLKVGMTVYLPREQQGPPSQRPKDPF